MNLFAYCRGNPLALIDPDGKCGTQNRIEFNMPGYGAAQSYQIVGGNVRNSVSRSTLELDAQGRLQAVPRRPWFLILENRL
mgnify:CR=1 FL=1